MDRLKNGDLLTDRGTDGRFQTGNIANFEAADDWEDDEQDSLPVPAHRKLELYKREDESSERAMARYWLKPEFLAADAIQSLTRIGGEPASLNELVLELESLAEEAKKGDSDRAHSLLTAQSHTLDAIFHSLIIRGQHNISHGYSETGREYLKLAMRAQAQCRATVDSLIAAKRPSIRQTNIAHQQQVNNFPPNELMEQQDERMDPGTPSEAVKGGQALETVGEEHGAEND
jgi:hypothetical protein